MTGKFTGRHMFAILVAFFGIVISVNIVNAVFASRTFGGLVVENSYVASQSFNGWLQKARDEKALDWTLDVRRGGNDRVAAALHSAGQAMTDAHITAIARHPLGRQPERTLRFRPLGEGRYESLEALPAGRWIVHFEAQAHGKAIHRIVDLG